MRQRRSGPLLGCAAALAVALALVFVQRVDEPWWINADPDGAYVGSSLNILLGNHTDYLDHPGLPTQDALALGFGAEYLIDKARGNVHSRAAFANREFLNLDRARPLYRGWAIFLFVGGALLVYWTLAVFLRDWICGLAGSLLYLSTPGLAPIAFLLRPDSALTALCLAAGVLIAAAFERRSAARYFAAAAVIGFTLMFKLPAFVLLFTLGVAAVWRPPRDGWIRPFALRAGDLLRRNVYWLVPLAAGWIALCVLFNRERLPIVTTDLQRHVLENGGAILGGVILAAFAAERFRIAGARRLFSTFTAMLVVAFVAGLVLPATLILDDGLLAIHAMWDSLTGGRVNANIPAFAGFHFSSLFRFPLGAYSIVFVLCVVAAVRGARQRVWWPALLALTSLFLGILAAARYSYPYYYGPAFAVAIPGAVSLFRTRDPGVPILAVVLSIVLVVPVFQHLYAPVTQDEKANAAAQRLADRLVKPGQVILVGASPPIEDLAFEHLVAGFSDYTPANYPYRFLPVGSRQLGHENLTPAYYVSTTTAIQAGTTVTLGATTYRLQPLPIRWGPNNAYGVARLRR